MSTQTEHIGLHQWESTDSFLREDFNEDNRKIDEEVGLLRKAVETFQASGSYTMEPSEPVDVTLGFQPSLVIILVSASNGYAIAVIMQEIAIEIYYDSTMNRTFLYSNSAKTTERGFQVSRSDSKFNYLSGHKAYYAAFQ